MLKEPIAAKQIRIRLHWANSAAELEEEVNSNLEAYPKHAIYGMEYQLVMVPEDGKKPRERHYMAVYFHP
ncbi:hypothetical protein ACFLVM_00860 [Chloroflexota bacterium]